MGKTELIKTFRRLAQEQGGICHIVAITHVAACLAQGMTIDLFLRKMGRLGLTDNTWIVVDEASQAPCA